MQCTRCGLVLHMSHVAWAVCLSVCRVGHTGELCKNGRIVFNRSRCHLTHVGPMNHVLGGDQDRTNPFAAARGGGQDGDATFCRINSDTR